MSHSLRVTIQDQPLKQPQQVVERFSRKWSRDHPDSPLAQSLVVATQRKIQKETYVQLWDGKEPLSQDDQIHQLDRQLREMAAAWKNFQEKLPEGERATRDSDPPDLNSVVAAIEQWKIKCDKRSEQGYRTAKENFQTFCLNLDAHSQLFSIFPKGDKYVSLLSGTISSIVKASVNNARVYEEFSIALTQIGYEITFWNNQVQLHGGLTSSPVDEDAVDKPENFSPTADGNDYIPKYKNEHIVGIVAVLYTKVFSLLANMMKVWFSSKWRRRIRSFDQTFCREYIQKPMEELRKLSNALQQESTSLTGKDIKAILAGIQANQHAQKKLYEKIDAIEESQRRHEERELKRSEGKFDETSQIRLLLQHIIDHQLLVGLPANKLLVESLFSSTLEVTNQLEPRKGTRAKALTPRSGAKTLRLTSAPTVSPSTTYTQGYLECASRSLESYSPHNFPISLLDQRRNQETASNIFQRLQAWLSGAESEIIWIYGPAQSPRPSMTTFAATHIVHTLEQANVPIIAYDCDEDNARADPLDELLNLVYALVRQLVWHVPDEFSEKKNFDDTRFELLNGKRETLKEALSLFRDLLGVMSKLIFCVIGGLNQLEDEGKESEEEEEDDDEDEDKTKNNEMDAKDPAEKHINRFLQILKKYKRSKVIKGLFVTDGYSYSLSKHDCFDDTVNAMTTAKIRSGRIRAGRRPLSRLQYVDTGSSAAEEELEPDSDD